MRYYTIQILNADGTQFVQNGQAVIWTSYVNGQTDTGALQVEFDIPVTTAADPLSAASVKVWGIPLATLSQASDFNGKLIAVYGGMRPGLPLATLAYNSHQSGLLVQGSIQQAFGNWIGVNQWVEFIITTNASNLGQQLNLSFNWKKGQPLSGAIRTTLNTAAPTYSTSININPNLVLAQDEVGVFENIFQFALYLKQTSLPIVGGGYSGVDVLVGQNSFEVDDGTTPTNAIQVLFTDLVGQPTWIGPQEVQLTVIMRADLQPFDYIALPVTQINIAPPNPLTPLSDKSIFQGNFQITQMRHIGNFRQADALAWISVINCVPAISKS